MKRIVSLSLAFLLLCGALTACGKTQGEGPAQPEAPAQAASGELVLSGEALRSDYVTDDNARVFYEIFVGSFSDSDGDGVGDLRGIINRMDYLNDGDPNSGLSLGVEGLWLSPIFSSPSYHKYDVADYYSIDPAFGTMEDLQELLDLCHERNVIVILDLPINHTSSRNEWFKRFTEAHRSGDEASEYYDYYSYIHKGESAPGRSFSQLAGTDLLYECNFSGDMPELNFDNPLVRQAVLDAASFYIEMGVDGFRFDAAKYIYFGDNGRSSDFWVWYLGQLRALKSDLYTVAEVWDSDGVTDVYYPATNCFDFTLSQSGGLIAETAKAGPVSRYTSYIQDYLDRVRTLRPDAMLVPFITNHDMDRASGFLTAASGQMKVAANLYLLCCGSPFIYYGEELGMRGSRGGANTDANRRLAMLWGDGDSVRDPVGSSYGSQAETSAAEQIGEEYSLYTYYKKLIMIRHANPEIARGDFRAVDIPGTKLGGFTSTWNGSTVCVLHNTTLSEVQIDLAEAGLPFTELRAAAGVEAASLDGTLLTIGAQTSVVLR